MPFGHSRGVFRIHRYLLLPLSTQSFRRDEAMLLGGWIGRAPDTSRVGERKCQMQREALETIPRIKMRINELALSGIHPIPIVDDPKLVVKAEVSIGDGHVDRDPALIANSA